MKKRNTLYRVPILLLTMGVTLFSACKKEYEIAPTPYTEITSFKIPYNAGKDTIVAAVDGETIYVSWPGSTEWPVPETVAPIINISKNASISPASGTAIALKDGLQYQVKAQDGTLKTYTIKLSNGALLPSFQDEETQVTAIVGQSSFYIRMNNLALDGSDNLYLVDDQNKSYKLILNTFTTFYVDQQDGSGIPAGDYYAQVINKFGIPVKSSKKFVTVPAGQFLPYVYFSHTKEWLVKRGEIINLPARHLTKASEIRAVNLKYTEEGNANSLPLTFLGISDDLKSIKVQIPEDAPIGLTSDLSSGISIRVVFNRLLTQTTPYHAYPIKIVE
ncbi:hypothetical protein [Sphingobacterium sp. DR205]|uniref:hypothetical protein n=1 Tax=Sphingobacterium sp. DR205 TaxID=2713573 RepID=UPI0013E4AB2D|nr:hypothetical protein [Sphingobacterium sp. DR205]QIH34395.1 hypothetical protein G6053_16540 [Sphingobacterium sp. DR205]